MRRPAVAEAVLAVGVGAVVAGALLLRPAAGAPLGAVPTPPAPAAPVAAPAVATGTAPATPRTAAVRRLPAAGPPARLRLPRLGVAAAVVPVGVARDGALDVPEDPKVLGWWSRGATPGTGRGSVVLDGHVDSARYGIGAFARLRDLRLGDRVELSDRSGRMLRYTVTARRSYDKADLPSSVFDQGLGERLVLITCGGSFDRSTAHYSQNVVLYAVPRGAGR